MKKLIFLLLMLIILLLFSSLVWGTWGTEVTFKGEKVVLNSDGLKVGAKAPAFIAVNKDFMEVSIGGATEKVQVIAFVPSFDSEVCKLETIAFNKKVSKIISKSFNSKSNSNDSKSASCC